MSLTKIANYRVNTNYGYKVFQIEENDIYPEFYSFIDGYFISSYRRPIDRLILDKWYNAAGEKKEYVFFSSRDSYPVGFHVFLNEKDARTWVNMDKNTTPHLIIGKVYFSNVIRTGFQYSMKTIVVGKIKILEILK